MAVRGLNANNGFGLACPLAVAVPYAVANVIHTMLGPIIVGITFAG